MSAPDDEPSAPEPKSRVLDDVTKLFETGRGNDLPGVAGTYWAAYNACSEYLTWERGDDDSTRLNNLWYGSSVKTNQRALDLAYNYVIDRAVA